MSHIFSDKQLEEKIFEDQESLYEKYHKYVKPTRWIYCKYCYGNRRPVISWYDGLVKCEKCDYGLWPLQDDLRIRLWIIGKWYDYIEWKFIRHGLEYKLEKGGDPENPKLSTPEQVTNAINECNGYIAEIEKAASDWKP